MTKINIIPVNPPRVLASTLKAGDVCEIAGSPHMVINAVAIERMIGRPKSSYEGRVLVVRLDNGEPDTLEPHAKVGSVLQADLTVS